MLEADAIMSEEVLALLDRAMRRLQPKPGDFVTLAYFSEFKERDGSPVAEFAPGYSPLIVEGPPPTIGHLCDFQMVPRCRSGRGSENTRCVGLL